MKSLSKLQELIIKYSSNSIKYKSLDSLILDNTVKIITPSVKVKRNEYSSTGLTPIISQEIEYISGYCDIVDSSIEKDEYICFGDHSEHIKFVDFAFVQGADGLKILSVKDKNLLLPKYLYYSLLDNYIRRNNYERHFKYLRDTSIPIPPIEIQEEVVKILDKFTELQKELNAELQARIKEYEWYRHTLLSFNNWLGGEKVE